MSEQMTHPLTPREKVARVVYDTVTRFDGDAVGTHLGLSAMIDAAAPTVDDERRIVKSVCEDIADSVLTALASGSGDYAELARLAEAAYHDYALSHISVGGGMRATVSVTAFITAANPARVLALLAEIAALRDREKAALKECSEWARQAGEAKGRLEASEWPGVVDGWRERATQAERQRDEAVGLLRRWDEAADDVNAFSPVSLDTTAFLASLEPKT